MKKEKRYWLRGGLMLAILALVLLLFSFLFRLARYGSIADIIILPLFLVFIYIGAFLFDVDKFGILFNKGYNFFDSELTILGNVVMYALVVVSFFIIGAIIGWIYGKIKNRREK